MIGTTGLVATVLQTYVVKGRIVCDCQRLGSPPRVFGQIPFIIQGGSPTRGFFIPPAIGSEVMVQQADDIGPYIVGTVGSTAMGLSSTAQSDSGDPTIDVNSAGLIWEGAQFIVDGFGAIRLAPASGKPLQVQLTGAGVMEVSRDGDASDRAALTAPLVAALQERDAIIADMQAQIVALSIAINLATPTTPPGKVTPYTATEPSAVSSDTLGSAVLRVSPATPSTSG